MNGKKWVLIGVSTGTTIVVLGLGLVAGLIWYEGRPKPWRTDVLTATDGLIRVVASRVFPKPCEGTPPADDAEVCGDIESLKGFRLSYTVTNNTDRDITLSATSTVRTSTSDGVLDDPPVPITLLTTFIPARRQIRVHLGIEHPIAAGQTWEWREALKSVGLRADVVGDFVLQDPTQRLEVRLPKPSVGPGKGITAFVEYP